MQVLPCNAAPTNLRERVSGVARATSLTGTKLRLSSRVSSHTCRRKVISPLAQAVQVDDVKTKVQNGAVAAAAPASEPTIAKEVMSKSVLGIILGGGAGTRLYPLTKKRAKPAVPLGAQYRLIDIPVSNCINSGVTKIYCLTQFNSASLNRHMSQAYTTGGAVGGFNKGFVEVLAASQSSQNKNWFQGTADAVRQYMWLFEEAMREGAEDFLILSGDHLYRMDYSKFVAKHRASGATITIAALPCDEKRASSFGLMKIDGEGRVVEFAEKPKGEALKKMQCDTRVLGVSEEKVAGNPYIASMGIYVMKAEALKQLLLEDLPESNDFGNEIIPAAKDAGMRIQAYAFEGYWEDIGTIEAFYNTNIALTKNDPNSFSLYSTNPDETLYTMSRFLPPSKIMNSDVVDSIIGDGCFIKENATVRNSVIGLRSLIGANCIVEDTLMMGADYYETIDECRNVFGCLPIGLGDNSIVRKAIIDKNARIGEGCQIINKEGIKEANKEEQGWIIKDGIIVVCKDSTIPAGTII